MNRKKGFSLIELLVVIAIIGILAGIAFPVFSRAKDSAYRSSDMSNMNEIRTALQLYRTDQGAYPPALFGYATGYMADGSKNDPVPTTANIVPADKAVQALFPKRVSSLETFRPALNRAETGDFNKEFVTAVWPEGVEVGGAPHRQKFGPAEMATRCASVGGTLTEIPRYFYKLSGFDSATVKSAAGERNELRYTLFWTGYTVADDPCTGATGSSLDNPRQLGYTEPPDTTIITWDSWFREYDGTQLEAGKRDIVLTLGGSARMVDSRVMASQAWAAQP